MGTARLIATYRVFSDTFDESLHVAAGMEFLSRGTYTYEVRHPPLARVAAALGPYLDGVRSYGHPNQYIEGDSLLHSGGGYRRNLELARWSVLPFFLIGAWVVFLWARSLGGEAAAAAAVAIYALTPMVLAHAGVATTDMAAAGGLAAAAFAFSRWLAAPTDLRRSVLLGVAVAFAIATKLSSLPFLAAAALLMTLARFRGRRPGTRIPWRSSGRLLAQTSLVALVAGFLVFASYGFDVGRVRGVPVPMPDLLRGIRFLVQENREGHVSYLLGEAYVGGRLLFFPVVLLVKTPIPLLLLGLAGAVVVFRRWWNGVGPQWIDPLCAAVAVMGIACSSRINIGGRHILGVYLILAVLCGVATARLLAPSSSSRDRFLGRAVAGIALAWLAWGTWRAHPDYLAYFNEAVRDPGAVLVDSDLDWGQDIDRLADTVRARGIQELTLAYFGSTSHPLRVLPVLRKIRDGDPSPRASGWFAISETLYRRGTARLEDGTYTLYPAAYHWLRDVEPAARVGRSIRLFYLPGDTAAIPDDTTALAKRALTPPSGP
jgi:hypothetical protein